VLLLEHHAEKETPQPVSLSVGFYTVFGTVTPVRFYAGIAIVGKA
jgi:hypothetical protein